MGLSAWDSIAQAVPFVLWAYVGVESASLNSELIEDPKRNVPLSTILGLVISAFLYISTCLVLMGIVPMETLANSSSPFSEAAKMIVGPVGATVMALCAVLKGGSSLIGWTLNIAQISVNAARDGLFPGIYGREDHNGVPVWNLLISGVLMSGIAVATASGSIDSQFNEVIDMSVILIALPYLYSVVSYVDLEMKSRSARRIAVAAVVAIAASAFCLWVVIGSDPDLTRDALVLLLLSIPIYPLFQRNLQRAEKPLTERAEVAEGLAQ